MSLLYPNEGKSVLSVEITMPTKESVNFLFTSDCGKFGCDEIMDERTISINELLEVLRDNEESDEL